MTTGGRAAPLTLGTAGHIDHGKTALIAICARYGRATLAGVRDELARRYAHALLEHLDAESVTRRDGDAHVLRRRGPAE